MKAIRISTASLLPDEIILQLLNNVSLKNLHRLKWVSKSWFSLITNEVLSQIFKSPNLSFYHSNYRRHTPQNKSSMLLDFLPNNSATKLPILTVLDCCGGLVVCSSCDEEIDPLTEITYYYVCNPVDKSYNQIITPFRSPLLFMLDFNPLISPHYKVIVVRWGGPCRDLVFGIYDSEKCCFETVNVRRPQRVYSIILGRKHSALWNGNVYLHCIISINSSTERQRIIGSESRTLMISGILGGSNENIVCEFIKFPDESLVFTMTSCSYMGTWRDQLRFVTYDDHEIRVWALRDTQEDEWTLEHICAYSFGSIEHSSDDMPPDIVGLHPLQNGVLFMFKNFLFVYDLDRMIFEKICEIGNDAIPGDIAMLFTEQLVFPFSPCFAKEVLA